MDDRHSLVQVETLNISTDNDTNQCDPFDVVIQTVGDVKVVVVSDYNNSCVKSFFTRDNEKCYSVLNLGNFPWKLATVKDNQVAVTVPGSRSIVLFVVKPDLEQIRVIKTREMYWGLAAVNGIALVAGSDFSPCVDILDLHGNVLKSMMAEDIGQNVIQEPDILCPTNDGNILIVDSGSKCLVCMTQSGKVLFVYPNEGKDHGSFAERPRGVAVSASGSIYLIEGSNSLIELTTTGQIIREMSIPGNSCEDYFGLCCDIDVLYIPVRDGHVKICRFP